MKNNLWFTVIAVIIVGVGGFLAGMKYQQNKFPSRSDFRNMRDMRQTGNTPSGFQGKRQGAEMIRGEIISQDENNVTLKLADDSSKIILLSDNTQISKATEGSLDDLTTGEQIMVFGSANSDGSVSANQIQLNFEPLPNQ